MEHGCGGMLISEQSVSSYPVFTLLMLEKTHGWMVCSKIVLFPRRIVFLVNAR